MPEPKEVMVRDMEPSEWVSLLTEIRDLLSAIKAKTDKLTFTGDNRLIVKDGLL